MDLSKLSDSDLEALQSGDLTKLSDAGLNHLSGKPTKTSREESLSDIPNAFGTGFNQGLTRLAGLPVDTVANVLDLGKAALGSAYTGITGKTADALQLRPREEVTGSGDWLMKQAEKSKLASQALHAQNPEYEGGYLQAAGASLPGSTTPGQAAVNVAGGLAGKLASAETGSTPAAVIASMLPAVLSKKAPAAPTQKSRTLEASQAEGYVVPPSQAGAGWLNNRLESVAGKAALNQDAVQRNQQTTNRLAARSVGIDSENLDRSTLASLREDAGRRGYAPIDRIQDIPTTPAYANRILDMENKYGNPTSAVSSLRQPAVSELATEMLPTSFTGPEINDLIKQLRETGNKGANTAYGNGPSAQILGKAQLSSSRALEGLVDEHLMQFGPSNIIPNLQAARQSIAQNHTIDKALNPSTNDVNALVLGQRIKAGKPTTGDQATIGNFAAAFPQLAKPAAGSPTPGVSALEAMAMPIAGMIGHGSTGNASGVLAGGLPLIRSPVRNMLLSKWYQKQFAKDGGKHSQLSEEDMGALSKMLLSSGVLDSMSPE